MLQTKPRLVVFASGGIEGGGSGFQNLVQASRANILYADIVGVISSIKDGGVQKKARNLEIPFKHFRRPFTSDGYREAVSGDFQADYIALSGWIYLVKGLDPCTTFNIHPGPLRKEGDPGHFGGKGMHGYHVHEKVLAGFKVGTITNSEVSMHFIDKNYDTGPVFLRVPVPIYWGDTVEELGSRVNKVEHLWQPIITNFVVNGLISWDGQNPSSLKLPKDYEILQAHMQPELNAWYNRKESF